LRIKSHWHNKQRPKSIDELAGALGFNAWRIASTRVNKLYAEGFNFTSNAQILDVIGEYLVFTIQVVDRLLQTRMEDAERGRFIQALARKLVDTMEDNRIEELGPGEYRNAFITTLNERLSSYADFSHVGEEPSYPMLRYFGTAVEEVMGGNSRWIPEQMVEVEAPEVVKTLRKALNDLLEGGWEGQQETV